MTRFATILPPPPDTIPAPPASEGAAAAVDIWAAIIAQVQETWRPPGEELTNE